MRLRAELKGLIDKHRSDPALLVKAFRVSFPVDADTARPLFHAIDAKHLAGCIADAKNVVIAEFRAYVEQRYQAIHHAKAEAVKDVVIEDGALADSAAEFKATAGTRPAQLSSILLSETGDAFQAASSVVSGSNSDCLTRGEKEFFDSVSLWRA